MKPITKTISMGTFGPEVMSLQRMLEQLQYGDFVPTGFFGQKTKDAVVKFQKANGILATGNVGDQTKIKLNSYLFPRQQILLTTAVSLLGVDASPADRADDENGCADSVNMVHFDAFGFEIGGETQTSEMVKVLRSSPRFQKTDSPKSGTIIISATEYPVVGHVGIMMDENKVMSNSSSLKLSSSGVMSKGIWSQNYSLQGWINHYQKGLGLKVEFFDLK